MLGIVCTPTPTKAARDDLELWYYEMADAAPATCTQYVFDARSVCAQAYLGRNQPAVRQWTAGQCPASFHIIANGDGGNICDDGGVERTVWQQDVLSTDERGASCFATTKPQPVVQALPRFAVHDQSSACVAVQLPDQGVDTACASRFLQRHAYQLSQYTYGQCPWLLRQRSTRVITAICPTPGTLTIILYGPE